MNLAKYLREGIKLAALFGAIALVVWSMPEYHGPVAQDASADRLPVGR
jgi:hypothetical protein